LHNPIVIYIPVPLSSSVASGLFCPTAWVIMSTRRRGWGSYVTVYLEYRNHCYELPIYYFSIGSSMFNC
jgi:hypothetical protein